MLQLGLISIGNDTCGCTHTFEYMYGVLEQSLMRRLLQPAKNEGVEA